MGKVGCRQNKEFNYKIPLHIGAEFCYSSVYMTWAAKRQAQYLLGLFGFFALIAFIIIYPMITKPATCTDGKQNGKETGVDCGGLCQLVCPAEASEPVILWYRAFPVSNNNYNLVAFVSNQNKNAALANISYEFKIYDTNNKLIGRRVGTTYLPPNQQFAIFEPRFEAGESEVRSVLFEFTPPFIWYKKEPTIQTLPIKVDTIVAGTDKYTPTLTARVTNDSIYDLPAFDVITILYDINHIAINASKTHKDSLVSNSTTPVLFTWPQPFTEEPVTRDLLVQINPFAVAF